MPVTVIVWMPVGTVEATVIVSVEVAERVDVENTTAVGFNAAVRPVIEPIAVRFTLPEKPFKPATVIVEVVVEPATIARDDGLPAILKSVTTTVIGTFSDKVPLVRVTVPVTVPS